MNTGAQQYYNTNQSNQWSRSQPPLTIQGNRGFGQANGFGSLQQSSGYGATSISYPQQQNGYAIPPPLYGQSQCYAQARSQGYQNGYHQLQNGYQQAAPSSHSEYSNGVNAGYVTKGFGGPYDNKEASGDFNGVNWNNQAVGTDSAEKQLFNHANSGINFDKYENIPVEVSGDSPPDAITTFADAKMHEWIQENVDKSGYKKPTPVQKHSIPTLLSNRDLMSCAQTGSGKTAAFLLPIINHILINGPEAMKQPMTGSSGRRMFFPAALVLSPTRELAIQIHKEAAKFSYRTNIVTAILYGGRENYREQINRLRNGCHILIATPGRLIDILEQGYIGLAGCRYLVLDEADRMLDMGFEPQIRKIVNQGMPAKANRVTAMFSATFPKEIQVLAQDFLKSNYVFLAVGRVGSTSENIDQQLVWVDEYDKRKALMSILEKEDPASLVLVFVETKRGANELAYYLQRQHLRAVAIHGDLKQFERERNLEMFRSGQNPVLVATAVAARGLDIPNVRHVVNYDLPGDIDEYVHRIGRTGRCGNTGRATSFFNEKNRGIGRDLAQLISESNQEVPDWLQRVAAEGRTSGRQANKRFGGTDHRRGGGSGFGGRTGYQSNGSHAQSNGFGGTSGYGFGVTGNGFSQQTRTYPIQINGYGGPQNGFGTSFTRGGFGTSSGGFSGGMMTTVPRINNFTTAPVNTFQPASVNGYQQQRSFGNWQN